MPPTSEPTAAFAAHHAEALRTGVVEALSPAGQWLGFVDRVVAISRRLREAVERAVQPCGSNWAMVWTLWYCDQGPAEGISQQDLVARLAVSPAQVSGLVEQLRATRLLKGHRGQSDRRLQFWQLTALGKARLDSVLADLEPVARWIEASLGTENRRLLEGALEQLAAGAAAQAEPRQHEARQKGAA